MNSDPAQAAAQTVAGDANKYSTSPLRWPVAWRREWDGDVSDTDHWLYTEDESDTRDGHHWQALYLSAPTPEEVMQAVIAIEAAWQERFPPPLPQDQQADSLASNQEPTS